MQSSLPAECRGPQELLLCLSIRNRACQRWHKLYKYVQHLLLTASLLLPLFFMFFPFFSATSTSTPLPEFGKFGVLTRSDECVYC